MSTLEQATSKSVPAGTVGGFHFGNQYKGCNGLYRATDKLLDDGRQVYVCDVCGMAGAMVVKQADTLTTER